MILKDKNSGKSALLGRTIAVLSVAITVGWATSASAVVKEYILTNKSGLNTAITSSTDKLNKTTQTPTWSDPSVSIPPQPNYGSDYPGVTLNRLRVEFSESSPGVIDPNGTVTVLLLDFYHDIDSSIAGVVSVTGFNDSRYHSAVGNLDGAGQVTAWTSLTGEAHAEISCLDQGGNTVCGTSGLPPSGTTQITHLSDPTSVLNIDTAGVPDAASLNTTFTNNFDDVNMEVTIDQTLGRQYYNFTSDSAAVPTMSEMLQLTLAGLLALAGFFYLSQSQRRGMTFSS